MKMLIIAACLVNYADDRGGIHQDEGDLIDVAKDTANTLARTGRALYVNGIDDPDKNGNYTASKEMVEAAKAMSKGKAKPPAGDPVPAA